VPYRRGHEASQEGRLSTGVRPKDLPGLLRWYEQACSDEMPDRDHVRGVWHDFVTPDEARRGIKPVGGSQSGAPAYSEPFRKRIENTPSEVDQDGYYLRPIEAALSRIARAGQPLMSRHLQMLAWAGFDWRRRADLIGWAHEEYEVYIREALIHLWREYRERTRFD